MGTIIDGKKLNQNKVDLINLPFVDSNHSNLVE